MTKEDLVRKVSKKLGVTLKDMRIVVDEIIDTINDALIKRETVYINGLFKIRVKASKPHYVMNMKTKERYLCEPKYKIEFNISDKVGDNLRKQKVLWEDLQDLQYEELRKKNSKKKEN